MSDRPLFETVEVAVDELHPDSANPRRISPKKFAALVRSIEADEQFLRARPVIALPSGKIVAGEQRWRAAIAAKRKTVFAFFAELDDARAREWLIRDNVPAGDWEGDALASFMADLRKKGGRAEATGMTDSEVDRLVNAAAKKQAGKGGGDEAIPELPDEPITRPGDLIELGPHRLLCADATDDKELTRLLGGRKVDAVVTDPPYAIYGSSTGLSAEVADDKMVRPFFRDILRASARAVRQFGHVYVCCDWRSWGSWWEVAKGSGLSAKNMIVWDKGGAGLGNNYANTHELLFFAAAIPKRVRMTEDVAGQRPVLDANVWRVPRVAGEERVHNAQKPVELFARAIRNSSDDGGRVLDLFCGAGTIFVACERAGRVGLSIEIEPAWCDVAVARWQQETGRKAKRPRRRAARGRKK